MTSPPSNRVWITGSAGLIGSWLCKTAPETLLRPLTRADVDLTDFRAVERLFRSELPRLVIHCAALSRSPECEANPGFARRANVEVTAHLAALAGSVPFFFFSTDLVFDGRRGNYDESANANPVNVYAETKARAEELVLRNRLHTVIRTSLNSGPSPAGNRGFDEQIRLAWERGQNLRLFTDEFRSPIAAEATARAVWELVAQNCTGIYHIAGAEKLSRYQIGETLAALWPELNPKFEPASVRESTTGARSPDTTLNCGKAQRLLSFQLPRWTEWIRSRSFARL